MLFSVIMPVYNAEDSLEKSVSSVLRQSCPDWELILIDDGSTDSSPEICDAFAAEYPEKIRTLHQKNSRQLAARLAGISMASGDYCIFLDADDSLAPDCVGLLKERAEAYLPDMIIYSYTVIGNSVETCPPRLANEEILLTGGGLKTVREAFFTGTLMNNLWTKAVKRETLIASFDRELSSYYSLSCGEDRLQSMLITEKAGSVLLIPDRLYVYDVSSESVTRSFSPENIAKHSTAGIYGEELRFIRNSGLPEKEYIDRLNAQHVKEVWHIFSRFYTECGKADRKRVTGFDWKSLYPAEAISDIRANPYLNETLKKKTELLLSGKTMSLRFGLRKKQAEKFFRKLLHGGNREK